MELEIPSENNEHELLNRAAQGDSFALEEIYDRYATLCYSVLISQGATPSEAGDILRRVFSGLSSSVANYESSYGQILTWLLAIVRMEIIARVGRDEVGARYLKNTGGEKDTAPRFPADTELLKVQREALRSAYFGGLSVSEIAEQLDRGPDQIISGIHRGMLKLRDAAVGGQVIDENEPNASLYVLNLLNDAEASKFRAKLEQNVELRKEVRCLRDATIAVAKMCQVTLPPESLRKKVLAPNSAPLPDPDFEFIEEPEPATTPSPEAELIPQVPLEIGLPIKTPQSKPMAPVRDRAIAEPSAASSSQKSWKFPWFLAVVLGSLLARQAYENAESGKLMRKREIDVSSVLDQMRAKLKEQSSQLDVQRRVSSNSEKKMTEYAASQKEWEQKYDRASAELVATEKALIETIGKLDALEGSRAIENFSVTILATSSKNKARAYAVALWNQENQEGLLLAENLPTIDDNRIYQVWISDGETSSPINAGLLKVNKRGQGRVNIKPAKPVGKITRFTLTEEAKAGADFPNPDGAILTGG